MMSMASSYSVINGQQTMLKTAQDEYDAVKNDDKDYIPGEASREQPASDVLHNHFDTKPQNLMVRGMTRSLTVHSLSASSTSTSSSSSSDPAFIHESEAQVHDSFASFGTDLRIESQSSSRVPVFDKSIRGVMEPYLRKARIVRERTRNQSEAEICAPIGSSVGIPYTGLRSERPFLFDVDTHPLHTALAETFGIQDLSKLHEEGDLKELMAPLLSGKGRRGFHECFDTFVTSFCIPLVHSIAMAKNIFHSTSPNSSISYRYQAFPNIRVVRPGDACNSGLTCDTASGHSIGCLRFHVPLTPTFGTNALYTESYPGREDWHPLLAKSNGLGFLFDGARCLHFNMENTTTATSVALDFVITLYRDGAKLDYVNGDSVCDRTILEDRYSSAGGYYDEAIIDMGLRSPTWQIVAKKHENHLLDPDERTGFPFV